MSKSLLTIAVSPLFARFVAVLHRSDGPVAALSADNFAPLPATPPPAAGTRPPKRKREEMEAQSSRQPLPPRISFALYVKTVSPPMLVA